MSDEFQELKKEFGKSQLDREQYFLRKADLTEVIKRLDRLESKLDNLKVAQKKFFSTEAISSISDLLECDPDI